MIRFNLIGSWSGLSLSGRQLGSAVLFHEEPGEVVERKNRIAVVNKAVIAQPEVRIAFQHLTGKVALEQASRVSAVSHLDRRRIVILANQDISAASVMKDAIGIGQAGRGNVD